VRQAPTFESWSELWEAAVGYIGAHRHILILDELPYAAESDPAMLSALQHAWDQHFKNSRVVLVICGSQVRTMEALQSRQSPLFGRLTGQWDLDPLPFSALQTFLPSWTLEGACGGLRHGWRRACLSGMARSCRSLVDNIRHVILAPGSMFTAEPSFLLYDEVREPQVYLAALKAIGAGSHSLDEISNAALIGKTHLPAYLARLQELRLVERRLPATVPPSGRHRSRQGRYHLSDAYFRFYFRFLAPHHDALAFEPDWVTRQVQQGLRAFVGQTAFEDLAQQWVAQQGRTGQIDFRPDVVGSHWSRTAQVNVVAVNWQERAILLGECKWGTEAVGKDVLRELVEIKTPRVLKELPDGGQGWRVRHALFARAGFTDAAQAAAQTEAAMLVDLAALAAGLHTS
jgi:AAA+ ATPase superfamily predicted ATPase